MSTLIKGLHHITLCAGGAQEDLDLFTRVMGQRLVKQTVLMDGSIPIYHLYYGNADAEVGSIATTFPYARKAGRAGSGQVAATSYAVPPGTLPFCYAVQHSGSQERFGTGRALDHAIETLYFAPAPPAQRGARITIDRDAGRAPVAVDRCAIARRARAQRRMSDGRMAGGVRRHERGLRPVARDAFHGAARPRAIRTDRCCFRLGLRRVRSGEWGFGLRVEGGGADSTVGLAIRLRDVGVPRGELPEIAGHVAAAIRREGPLDRPVGDVELAALRDAAF